MRKILPLIVLGLVGCSSDNVNIRQQWGKDLSQLGLVPFYPMRENAYVGDIYLYIEDPCENGSGSGRPQSLWIGSLPEAQMRDLFEQVYGDRPEFPSTTPAKDKQPDPPIQAKGAVKQASNTFKAQLDASGGTFPTVTFSSGVNGGASAPASSQSSSGGQPTASAANPIYVGQKSASRYNRLRQVAFPSFTFSRYSSATAAASIPIYSFLFSPKGGYRNGSTVSLSLSSVEEQYVPDVLMESTVNEFIDAPVNQKILGKMFNPDIIMDKISIAENVMIAEEKCRPLKSRNPPKVITLNHIYYTRSIDYNFDQNSAFAAQAVVALQGAVQSAAPSQMTTSGSPTVATNAGQAAADALLGKLTALGGGAGPGGTASVAFGTDGALSLKQTFDRPLAFAYDVSVVKSVFQLWDSFNVAKPSQSFQVSAARPLYIASINSRASDLLSLVDARRLQVADASEDEDTRLENCAIGDTACRIRNFKKTHSGTGSAGGGKTIMGVPSNIETK